MAICGVYAVPRLILAMWRAVIGLKPGWRNDGCSVIALRNLYGNRIVEPVVWRPLSAICAFAASAKA
ncbi:hypothetical protein SAMN05216264_107169 [Pseudomonas marincola]|nr:hypothetical protein SAMN05216264_107169 [Pseudomonas marincola]